MSSTPKKYRFHSVFLFFRRRSALTFLFRHPKFLLNFFKKLLTNYFSHSMISNVSGRQIQNNLHMREWLSWWSTTLPRSGPRVRVPSRALLLRTGNLDLQGFLFFVVVWKLITVYCLKSFVHRRKFFLSTLFIIKQAGIDSIPANVFLYPVIW